LIAPGDFTMGDIQQVGQSYEKPVHKVTITNAFSIGKYPVTFKDYDKFTIATGKPLTSDYHWGRENRPVININLNDARAYSIWLSAQTGHRYRLPSEAEWEYAARAGTNSIYPWGNKISTNKANCSGCGLHADKKMTSPVGQFSSNAWGLYDMIGDVWELTEDCWNYNYDNAPFDGSPWKSGDCSRGVLRGGSWGDTPQDLRSSTRLRSYSGTRTVVIGFRLIREN
ncbi:MAG: formylglycine-generating enzyme family protein, partial [Gammaproteobacteria bacterium]|nr:formylglycine-generating enzyme family protein [Gammaproteobacteria bacterium]